MKLAVTRCDGDTEIIVLNEPVHVSEGCVGGQACIHSADGMDHYFRLSDGCYDGYGMGCPGEGWTEQQAVTLRESLQDQRMLTPLTFRRFCYLKVCKLVRWARWWSGYLQQKPGYPKFGDPQ
jgi:hypothetical protein